jgi:hypothetical protein
MKAAARSNVAGAQCNTDFGVLQAAPADSVYMDMVTRPLNHSNLTKTVICILGTEITVCASGLDTNMQRCECLHAVDEARGRST